jgi:hypothetical protein
MKTSWINPAAPPECFKSKARADPGKAADYLQLQALSHLSARIARQMLHI